MISFLINLSISEASKMEKWCQVQFGPKRFFNDNPLGTWTYMLNGYYGVSDIKIGKREHWWLFDNEEDAVLFSLKWGPYEVHSQN